MSSEKKKRVPAKKAKLSRRVVRKSATGQFVAQKASSRRDKLLFKVTGAPAGDHGLMMHNIRQGLSFESIETLAEAFESPRKEMPKIDPLLRRRLPRDRQ